MGQNFFLK